MTALYQENIAHLNEVDDFEYKRIEGKNQAILTGLSNKGVEKVEDAYHVEITLPEYDNTGKNEVVEIGSSFTSIHLENRREFFRTISILDSWKNILTIGNDAFSSCRILSIPNNWGKVITIGDRAFHYSNLQNLPDTWGEVRHIGDSAFEKCKIKKLPDDFGEVRTLGSRSFISTLIEALPEDFGKIYYVGSDAFCLCENLKKVPDGIMFVKNVEDGIFSSSGVEEMASTWGTFTRVPSGFLRYTKVKNLPDDWGNIEVIEDGAFEASRVSFIPLVWGNVHTIGNRAFAETGISVFPDDFSDMTIKDQAFADCRNIEELPRGILYVPAEQLGGGLFRGCSIREVRGDWGTLKFIPYGFLRYNPLFTIPEKWGSVVSIQSDAFYECFLNKIPDDWENVKIVQSGAFSTNRIKRVPDDFSGIDSLGAGAFSYNMIENVPDMKRDYSFGNAFGDQWDATSNRSSYSFDEEIFNDDDLYY